MTSTIKAISLPSLHVAKDLYGKPLSECVRNAVDGYLDKLNGHQIDNLYELVLSEIEKPLLAAVMQEVRGNQSKAAQLLGMSRSTLRKKLQLHALD
jgi:Fis family transcriptional regulator